MTNKFVAFFTKESSIPGKGAYFAGLAVNIVLLYVVNNLRYMGITQLTEANLVSCLWAINIVFTLAIIGNFTLLLYRPTWFHHIVQTLINAAGVNAFFFIYKQYPFNLNSATLDSIIRVVLLLVMLAFFVAFLLEFYRFGITFEFPKKKPAFVSTTALALIPDQVLSLTLESLMEKFTTQTESKVSPADMPVVSKPEDNSTDSEPTETHG